MSTIDDALKIIEERPEVGRQLLRADFASFIKIFHYYLHKQNFIFKPFHRKLINHFENIVFGRNDKQNLAISISPRTGKSKIVKYFISWTFAINKNCQNIYTSYSDKLIQTFSGEIRDLINSELYRKLFNIELKQDTQSKSIWNITNGGGLVASPLGGSITGFGAGGLGKSFSGAVFIDDPLKAADYKSATARNNCIDFYVNTLKSRREQLEKTPIVLIMQRLHKEDLVGFLKENEKDEWEFVEFPAIVDGQSIFPEKLPLDYLEKLEISNPYLFHSQYMQEPITLGGGIFKHEWWNYYSDINTIDLKRIFITADTAMKTNRWNDYSAIGVWGVSKINQLYLIDLLHGKYEAPDLEKAFLQLWNKWQYGINNVRTSAVYIEDKASGIGLIQTLKRTGGIPVIPVTPESDKLLRANNCVGYAAGGNVFLPPPTTEITKKFTKELEEFSADMSHAHDDICDEFFYAVDQVANQKGLF